MHSAPLSLEVEVDGAPRRVVLARQQPAEAHGWIATIDGREIPVDVCEPMPGVLSLLVGDAAGGRSYRCVRIEVAGEESISIGGREYRVGVSDPRSLQARRRRAGGGNGKLEIKASMPGRVARVLVAQGDNVTERQGIVVIEAMKMQNELKSTRDGRVAELRVAAGDKVTAGQVLAVVV